MYPWLNSVNDMRNTTPREATIRARCDACGSLMQTSLEIRRSGETISGLVCSRCQVCYVIKIRRKDEFERLNEHLHARRSALAGR
jgi:hypothetical protein